MTTHWGATFEKTGEKLIEFDLSYLLDRTAADPRIVATIAHQDEMGELKKLGLLPEDGR